MEELVPPNSTSVYNSSGTAMATTRLLAQTLKIKTAHMLLVNSANTGTVTFTRQLTAMEAVARLPLQTFHLRSVAAQHCQRNTHIDIAKQQHLYAWV